MQWKLKMWSEPCLLLTILNFSKAQVFALETRLMCLLLGLS